MTRKQRYVADEDSQTPFETAVRALRPFATGYEITNNKRVKMEIAGGAYNSRDLQSVIVSAEGHIEEGNGFNLFVRFDVSNEEAAAIMARVFGEATDDTIE